MKGLLVSDNEKKLIIFAAGATGGHLLPARFVADILQRDHNCRIEFIGAGKGLEKSLIEGHGIPLHVFEMVGVHKRGIKGYFEFIICAIRNFFGIYSLIKKSKPSVVVGFGAYTSVLPVICAKLQGIPTLIHDAEREVGLANKLLAYFARTATAAYPDTRFPGSIKIVYTGQPIQPSIQNFVNTNGSRNDFPEKPSKLLIIGGSQGSKTVDQAILGLAEYFKKNNLQIWHQCRAEDISSIKKVYKTHELTAVVEPFIKEPLEAYLWADLLIGRSGAGISREVEVLGIPSIFIPLPGNAKNNHQYQNAQALADKGKALVIQEGGVLSDQLKSALELLLNSNKYSQMANVKIKSEHLQASSKIADEIVKIM